MRAMRVAVVVFSALLLGGGAVRGEEGAGIPFKGFYYEDQRSSVAADATVTHVRFTYSLAGFDGALSKTRALVNKRQGWWPDLAGVTEVKVQPLHKPGDGDMIPVGSEVKASGANLFVVCIFVFTRDNNGQPINMRSWHAMVDPVVSDLGGSVGGFENFHYTDHSLTIRKVERRFKRRSGGSFQATGDPVYTVTLPDGDPGPLVFSHDHDTDANQPHNVSNIEVKTFETINGPAIETVTVIHPDPMGSWRDTWFETHPGLPHVITEMTQSVP